MPCFGKRFFFLRRHSIAFVGFFKRKEKCRSDGQMASSLFMNIEQGDRMAVRMIFHTLLPSLNIAATNHVPQTTFSVFSHFILFFSFFLLLSFMILSFQFFPLILFIQFLQIYDLLTASFSSPPSRLLFSCYP